MPRTTQATAKMHFSSTLDASHNKLWGAHLAVPQKIVKTLVTGNSRRVICTLNGVETFQCALIPHGNGSFVITVNKKLRDKLGLRVGVKTEVVIEKDESKYGLPLPEEFAEVLRQDKNGSRIFHSLTAGKQRTLLYIIGQKKSPDARIEAGLIILEHLKANKGTIQYRQLNESLKKSRRVASPITAAI